MSAAAMRLDGELTIYRAAELKPRLLAALEATPDTLEIDLSGVTDFDTAGLQLRMVAHETARASGRAIRLVGHSPAVLEVFELLDCAWFFGDPLVTAVIGSPA
jgi:anti-anti-sigma factor